MILLASASPRRQDLLTQHGVDFRVIPNLLENEPSFESGPSIKEQILNCASLKALASAAEYQDWVLSADTVVAFGQTILGKPNTTDAAYNMLHMLSGQTHVVYTGLCLYHPISQQTLTHIDEAQVTFNTLSDTDITTYIREKKPFDKAGSYGIQDVPPHFISSVTGDIETVIGLRVKSVLQLLRDCDIV